MLLVWKSALNVRQERERIAVRAQLETSVRHHASLAGEGRHQRRRNIDAVGNVPYGQIQAIDSYICAVLARDVPQMDFAVGQQRRR